MPHKRRVGKAGRVVITASTPIFGAGKTKLLKLHKHWRIKYMRSLCSREESICRLLFIRP